MKLPQIEIEGIPAPGEPITPKIHPDNQKLIDEELAERAQRARAKLRPRQLWSMRRRYRVLWKALRDAKWNQLVSQRWHLEQDLQRMQYEIKGKQGLAWISYASKMAKNRIHAGRVQAQINRVKPIADEFEKIRLTLSAHAEVIAWEKEDAQNKAAFRREARAWEEQLKAAFRQSARLHHIGEDSRGRSFCVIPKIEQVIFKDDRVLYQIAISKQTIIERLWGRWHSVLPYNVDIPDLASDETLQNLSAACDRIVTVERSKVGRGFFYAISRLDSADGLPNRVLYSKVVEWYPSKDHAKTPWAAGVAENRKVEFFNFEETPHLLLAGSTKGGKSNHLNQMIATFATMNTPQELGIILVDLKGGIEFVHWSGLKHQVRPMVKRADDVLESFQWLRTIMERRLEMFNAIRAKNLASYNAKASRKLPRLLLIVDEMATLMGLGELTTAIHNELRVLTSQGRAVGINLVICTQHSSVEVLPGWIKANMGVRGSARMPSMSASQVILDTTTAAMLPNVPGRMVFSVGRYEIVVQSPYISDNEIALAVMQSQSFPDPDRSEFNIEKPIELPKAIFSEEDAIEMALTMFQGQLSPSKIFKQIGKDVLSDREVRQLVDDILERGFDKGIEHKGVLYKPRKIRKTHILEAVGQPTVQLADQTDEMKAVVLPIEEPA